jgi:hypothetical protein
MEVLVRRLPRICRVPLMVAVRTTGSKPSANDAVAAAIERDYAFLSAALTKRRELAKLYDMDKIDERSAMDLAKAVAARVGLAMPVKPDDPPSKE